MKRIPKRRIEMERRPGLLCHRIQKLLDKAKDKSWEYICDCNGEWNQRGIWLTCGGLVPKKTCTCRKWQLTALPCPRVSLPYIVKLTMMGLEGCQKSGWICVIGGKHIWEFMAISLILFQVLICGNLLDLIPFYLLSITSNLAGLKNYKGQ